MLIHCRLRSLAAAGLARWASDVACRRLVAPCLARSLLTAGSRDACLLEGHVLAGAVHRSLEVALSETVESGESCLGFL